jgi:hypothetical protein
MMDEGKRAECVNDGGCSFTIHTMDIMMFVRQFEGG